MLIRNNQSQGVLLDHGGGPMMCQSHPTHTRALLQAALSPNGRSVCGIEAGSPFTCYELTGPPEQLVLLSER